MHFQDVILKLQQFWAKKGCVLAQPYDLSIMELDAVTFKNHIDKGLCDVLVDVRSTSEWEAGHIEGATLVENLASFGSGSSAESGSPADLAGCEYW